MKPFVMLMTGISGSGKSTLANAVSQELRKRGISVEVVDGDDTRERIGHIFGHDRKDRIKMSYVNQLLGQYLLRNGINVIFALVCPYEEMRERFRSVFGDAYIEVFVSASQAACAKRDVKGLYQRDRTEGVAHLNGTNDIFEIPRKCDLIIDSETLSVEEAKKRVLNYLQVHNFMPAVEHD